MVQLQLLLELFPQELTLQVVFPLLHINSMLVLQFPMIKFYFLLCLDLLALMIESLLHLIFEALLLFLHDLELRLVSVLQLSESLPVPTLLAC